MVPIRAFLVLCPRLFPACEMRRSATWTEVAEQAERWSAEETLRWAAARFAPRMALATGFGAEGCVLIDLVARHSLPIDLFTLDTGLLFPETYGLWRELEERYGVTIRRVKPAQTVRQQAETRTASGCGRASRRAAASCARWRR